MAKVAQTQKDEKMRAMETPAERKRREDEVAPTG
jgi:hypothetical protein